MILYVHRQEKEKDSTQQLEVTYLVSMEIGTGLKNEISSEGTSSRAARVTSKRVVSRLEMQLGTI